MNRNQLIENLNRKVLNQHKDINVDNTYYILHLSDSLICYINDKYINETDLNRTQTMILSLILRNGGVMTPTALKKRLLRSNNAITKSIDKLDKLGLTESYGSEKDRRIRNVSLTEKGLKLIEEKLSLRKETFKQATNCLTNKEAKTLNSILKKIKNHIQDIIGNYS